MVRVGDHAADQVEQVGVLAMPRKSQLGDHSSARLVVMFVDIFRPERFAPLDPAIHQIIAVARS